MKFQLLHAEKERYPVLSMCRWLGVSRSGYYAWLKRLRTPSQRELEDAALLVEIRALYREHQRRYGSPRIHRALRQKRPVGRTRVERLMRINDLRARPRRRFVITTDSRATKAPAANLLQRDFRVGQPNRAWVGDVTFIPTPRGWVYLAVLLDIGSRRVVGWATSRHNDTQLALVALQRALALRNVPAGLVHHTDRGTPYASFSYQRVLRQHGITVSMSRKGNCWDNAVAESFFATLKVELDFTNDSDIELQLGRYIDHYYNTERMHSSLGYLTPAMHETTHAA